MLLFIMGREQRRAIDLVGELIYASTSISYLNILYIYDREISVQVKINYWTTVNMYRVYLQVSFARLICCVISYSVSLVFVMICYSCV
jgi:hypothetical protein